MSVISQMNANLFIGSLLSVKELRNIAPEDSSWLVVSVVSAPAMLALVHEQLRSVRSCRSDLTVKHVEYKLKDKLDEVFVSLRLEEVLQEMDAYLLGHSNSELHRQCCLVHCVMGQSRSAAVIAAWLVTREGSSLEGALDKIRSARPAIHPNMSFIAGLRAIEQCGSVDGAVHRLSGCSAASSSDKR
jgi:Dual specificity phosphatase, catalytic domain